MKLKSFFTFLAVLLGLLPAMILSAAYNDVSLTTDARITVGSETLTVSGSTASVASIVVTANNFQVALQPGSSITITSNSATDLNYSTGGASVEATVTCSSSSSSLALSSPVLATTVTVTLGGTCTPASSSSNPVGGGIISSGGGGLSIPPVAPTPAKIQATIPPMASGPAISAVFTKTLSFGSRGSDVTRLQTLLSGDSSIYPEGTVSSYFGPATKRAVGRFQEKYGIAKPGESGYGTVGPKTGAKLAETFGGISGTAGEENAPAKELPLPVGIFTKPLRLGVINPEVKLLQVTLNLDSATRLIESGVGSHGNESYYFGALTEKAVQRFQEKYGIAKPGESGYGTVGPKTRAQLNKIIGR